MIVQGSMCWSMKVMRVSRSNEKQGIGAKGNIQACISTVIQCKLHAAIYVYIPEQILTSVMKKSNEQDFLPVSVQPP